MFINDFENSNEYKLQQITHTLKSVHGIELSLDEATQEDLNAIQQSSEIIKNSIVSESQFNTYNTNPEYTKHMLIMEAIRLYLTEIAPKRSKKTKVKENAVPSTPTTSTTQAQNKPQPGMINVQKGTDKKTVPAAQLANLQQQGYSVVGDDEIEEKSLEEMPSVRSMDRASRSWADKMKYLDRQRRAVSPYKIGDDIKRRDAEADMEKAKAEYFAKGGTVKKVGETSDVESNSELASLMKKYGIEEEITDEGNEFSGALAAAKAAGKDTFEVGGKTYNVNESVQINEAKFDHDSYQASMARSELYRNTKYALDMMKMIKPEDDIQPWIAANLTKAANYLDKIFHYLDYYTTFEPSQLPEDMDMDPEVSNMELGETSGSIARESLLMIVEYSTKLFNMIQPGDKLEGWVAMKLTTASECVSSSKHYLEYAQFEKHASDMLHDVDGMEQEGTDMKKPIKESVGQMLYRMMINEDQDLAQAQVLLAAKALSDDLQDMAEKLAKMSVEDLMPLVDSMKDQFGPEAADGYNSAMKQSLESLLNATTEAKETSDNAITQLQGGQIPGAEDTMGGEAPAPEVPGEEGGEAAMPEVPEEPLGRAKKEEEPEAVAEAWGTTMKTKEKDKGMWDGWTVAELKAEKAKLMKKEERSAAEQKKVKQIDFAIRAKQKNKWGKIKESEQLDEKNKENAAKMKDLKQKGVVKKDPTDKISKFDPRTDLKLKKDGKVEEAKKAKPDFLDVDKDGNKKESFKKAVKDKAKADKNKKVDEAALKEVAPPGKKAEEFIKGNKESFKKRYGKRWQEVLYATAWKKFGDKSESYVKAEKMLESNLAWLAKIESAFAAHKKQFSRMLSEGKVDDPLNMGYGLDGELMLEQMTDMNAVIAKLREMIKNEVKQGTIDLIVAEQTAAKIKTVQEAKAAAPYGVAWKTKAGKTEAKFFENSSDRDYWLGLKKLKEAKLINPDHFDKQINKLSGKKD